MWCVVWLRIEAENDAVRVCWTYICTGAYCTGQLCCVCVCVRGGGGGGQASDVVLCIAWLRYGFKQFVVPWQHIR